MTYFFRILTIISALWCANPLVCAKDQEEAPKTLSIEDQTGQHVLPPPAPGDRVPRIPMRPLPPQQTADHWISQYPVLAIPALLNILLGAGSLWTLESMCNQPGGYYEIDTITAAFALSAILLAWLPSRLIAPEFRDNIPALRSLYFGLILFTTLEVSLLMACG